MRNSAALKEKVFRAVSQEEVIYLLEEFLRNIDTAD
jgi:hypothetical protein